MNHFDYRNGVNIMEGDRLIFDGGKDPRRKDDCHRSAVD
jgi:hypothetical protein